MTLLPPILVTCVPVLSAYEVAVYYRKVSNMSSIIHYTEGPSKVMFAPRPQPSTLPGP